MKKRLLFYLFIAALLVLDSVLLRSPNLLGKIGLVIYKYQYLLTFWKTLATVSIVVGSTVLIAEVLRVLASIGMLKRSIVIIVLLILMASTIGILIKTGLDFSTWTYSHTGRRFKYGAYLLPCILLIVLGYHLFTLPKAITQEQPSSDITP